ncbi:MAG: hypothetical protein A3F72_09890 [Bacteroidetes bacterium RIFCSPLOWO2_12_FULL_35_15]|nr:MAG: hypothetical protein A3F72_09890 [Bacteroidetes bacterium RIFCSPLOWO2_12_FULL_35_15]
MNRTITMNLSGIIFHIEEDAYDMLNKYLSTIKGYFKDSDGRDEIMSDIESRIAEMLQEKVSKTKQAVLMNDVESVIAVMGKPEDFAGESGTTENKESTAGENKTYSENKGRRRVFRDPDDKVIGGVCSGIASYFDFDPIWLRAAFAISFFVFGTGLLLYIILIIIIPKAKTTAEKLEMRGEKVDVNNIGKAVNEEFEDFKKRMKNFGDEVKSSENKERIRTAAEKFRDFVGDVFFNMLQIAGKIFAFIFIFIGIALMIGLMATIFGRGTISIFDSPMTSIHFSIYELSSAVLPNDLPIEFVVIGLILFIGIPLLSMIYGGIKYLFRIKQKNKIVKYTANILWLTGLVLLTYVGIQVGTDFSEQATTKQIISISQPIGNTLYLDMKPSAEDDLDVTYMHHRKVRFGDWTMISKDDKSFRLGYPEMNIVKSETDSFELVAIKSAQGFDKKDATYRAKNINYAITQMDSIILFNSYFDIEALDKLRAQNVKILLKVPVNKFVYLSKRMEKIIFDIDNVNDALDSDMVNRKWIMTNRGLECIDCEGLENVHKH